MHEVNFGDPDDPFTPIAEALFRSFVEDGSIIISDQSADEIVLQYKALVAVMLAENTELHRIPDHRSILWQRAENERVNGTLEIAVTLYALWIEHVVNGNLIVGLQKNKYDEDIIDLLIRKLNIIEKTSKLWRAAGLEPLPDSDISLIRQIMDARNGFVHYKWKGYNEATDESNRKRIVQILERVQTLIKVFHSCENALLWNNREDEIINYYREDLKRHAEEAGPFVIGNPDEKTPPGSSPS